MKAEDLFLDLAHRAAVNPDRAMIAVSVSIVPEIDFVSVYGTEAWAIAQITIPQSVADHLEGIENSGTDAAEEQAEQWP